MYCFRPPGNCTTGICPAHILSLMAQVVNPMYAAAAFKGIRRGVIGLEIPCAVFISIFPVRFAMVCPVCARLF